MDLALFDFDGTVTTTDTFSRFLRFSSSRRRIAIGTVVLGPLVLGFKRGLVPGALLRRACVAFCFRNRSVAEIAEHGRRFARTFDVLLRPEAMARLRWHQDKGDRVAIVSASLSAYLDPWSAALGVELLCSKLAARAGLHTGRYEGKDCSGEEKARRVRDRYDLKSFDNIYAYGDTAEDHALLSLANHRFFRWKELDPTLPLEAMTRGFRAD
jgi:phosphatidylglycerophosphatase C